MQNLFYVVRSNDALVIKKSSDEKSLSTFIQDSKDLILLSETSLKILLNKNKGRTFKFTLFDKRNLKSEAVLYTCNTGSSLRLNSFNIDILTPNIKNPIEFLSSFLVAQHIKHSTLFSKFTKINIDDLSFKIDHQYAKNKKKNNIKYYYIIEGRYFEKGQKIQMTFNNETISFLPDTNFQNAFKLIKCPNNWQYTKNEKINHILKSIFAPFNVNKDIIDAISKSKDRINKYFIQNENEKLAYVRIRDGAIIPSKNKLAKNIENFSKNNFIGKEFILIKKEFIKDIF